MWPSVEDFFSVAEQCGREVVWHSRSEAPARVKNERRAWALARYGSVACRGEVVEALRFLPEGVSMLRKCQTRDTKEGEKG